MKQRLFLPVFTLSLVLVGWVAGAANAQSADAKTAYCMMTAYKVTPMAKKTKIELDFGDTNAFVDNTLRDEMSGKAEKFNSAVDALNHMSADGWQHVGGYVLNAQTTNPTWVFLLKRG